MRTAINVVIILGLALGIGLSLRSIRIKQAPRDVVDGGSLLSPDALAELPADQSDSNQVDSHGEMADQDGPAGASPGAGNDELAKTGWLTEFELTERSGEQISSRDLRGQPYVASFFFSTCPSVCKLQNEKMQQLQTEFKGQPVRFVAISVDPEADTPEVLTEYAKRYRADPEQWMFFTGDLTYIRRVGAEMYSVAVSKKFHTEKFILVSPDGKVVDFYRWNDAGQMRKLQADIRALFDRDLEPA